MPCSPSSANPVLGFLVPCPSNMEVVIGALGLGRALRLCFCQLHFPLSPRGLVPPGYTVLHPDISQSALR